MIEVRQTEPDDPPAPVSLHRQPRLLRQVAHQLGDRLLGYPVTLSNMGRRNHDLIHAPYTSSL
ncbi:hypothetical protein [Hoeflea sp.]|uniref:hypothetical protein n=1 Tax=Hoeflea sp. TaxID=1940281 RepID=UPI003F4AA665